MNSRDRLYALVLRDAMRRVETARHVLRAETAELERLLARITTETVRPIGAGGFDPTEARERGDEQIGGHD